MAKASCSEDHIDTSSLDQLERYLTWYFSGNYEVWQVTLTSVSSSWWKLISETYCWAGLAATDFFKVNSELQRHFEWANKSNMKLSPGEWAEAYWDIEAELENARYVLTKSCFSKRASDKARTQRDSLKDGPTFFVWIVSDWLEHLQYYSCGKVWNLGFLRICKGSIDQISRRMFKLLSLNMSA